jgi:hypothetical protein
MPKHQISGEIVDEIGSVGAGVKGDDFTEVVPGDMLACRYSFHGKSGFGSAWACVRGGEFILGEIVTVISIQIFRNQKTYMCLTGSGEFLYSSRLCDGDFFKKIENY